MHSSMPPVLQCEYLKIKSFCYASYGWIKRLWVHCFGLHLFQRTLRKAKGSNINRTSYFCVVNRRLVLCHANEPSHLRNPTKPQRF